MTKPILDLYGDPVDRGRVHGEKMSVQIGQNIERYMKRFELLGFGRDAVLSESAKWSEA